MVKGSVITKDGKRRNHSIQFLMNLEKDFIIIKSYNNNQINMVDIHKEDLDRK